MKEQMIPGVRLLRALMNEKWNAAGALAELLDNAFGELRGAANTVWICWDAKTRTLIVRDNGAGMVSIGHLFALGRGVTEASSAYDPGYYGFGGSKALLNVAKRVKIWTLRDDKVAHADVAWENCLKRDVWPEVDNDWKNATRSNCPKSLLSVGHGTLILMRVHEKRRINVSDICDRLRDLYDAGIRSGELSIFWNDDKLKPKEIKRLNDRTDFRIDLGDGFTAFVRAGWSDNVKISESTVAINFGIRRVMTTRKPFVSYTGGKIFVAVDLSHEWRTKLTDTKDAIDDEELFERLCYAIFEGISDMLDKLETQEQESFFIELGISFGTILNSLIKKAFPDTTGWKPKKEVIVDDRRHRKVKKPSDPGGEEDRLTRIHFKYDTDQQLGGIVCKSDITKEGIEVRMNKEIRSVQSALGGKNKSLLAALVAPAIALNFISDDNLMGCLYRGELLADAKARVEFQRLQHATRIILEKLEKAA